MKEENSFRIVKEKDIWAEWEVYALIGLLAIGTIIAVGFIIFWG